MIISLIGQPNCGKSTIFNYFSGYKAAVSNFPGTTVKYTVSQVVFEGEELTCVDLPGVYSLTSIDPAERESRNYLLAGKSDVIINVMDASLLSRSLELTLELMSLERPLVVALNMMDEAARKGIVIDAAKLSKLLGVPVVTTVAAAGRGLTDLLRAALSAGRAGVCPTQTLFSRDVEEEIDSLADQLDFGFSQKLGLPWRFMLVKALEDDPYVIDEIGRRDAEAVHWVRNSQKILALAVAHPMHRLGVPAPDLVDDIRVVLQSLDQHEAPGQPQFLGKPKIQLVGQRVDFFFHVPGKQGLGRAHSGPAGAQGGPQQIGQAPARSGDGGHHRHAQKFRELGGVDHNPLARRLVHHVQGHHQRALQTHQLQGEFQAAAQER